MTDAALCFAVSLHEYPQRGCFESNGCDFKNPCAELRIT
jgi:hypothetical protein